MGSILLLSFTKVFKAGIYRFPTGALRVMWMLSYETGVFLS